ncbi:MAG: peptide-methionine (R)-S-oxide reductase MsrB [bacterium]|nr:peptide-methionine (R)-S-oxide reductase MsrB [bacterium]
MHNDDLKKKLTAEQYRVTQEKGTEAPFTGKFVNHHEKGMYTCVVCGKSLSPSDTKFDSGTGWPSFDKAIPGAVTFKEDTRLGSTRTEITCTNCGAHLGHVFDDLPAPRPDSFFVYAILCDDNLIYIGQTDNLQGRWVKHNNGTASDHTKKHKPLRLIHYEEYKTRTEAIKREHDLKTGFGRKWIKREFEAGRLPVRNTQTGTRQAGGLSGTGKRYCVNSVCLGFEER